MEFDYILVVELHVCVEEKFKHLWSRTIST